MNRYKTKLEAMLPVCLLAVSALLCCGLSSALAIQNLQLTKYEKVLSSIPMRNDNRRLVKVEPGCELSHVRFLDDSTLAYVSGSTLVIDGISDGGCHVAKRLEGHTSWIQDYEVSPDRTRIVTSSSDGTLRLWDPRTGGCLAVSDQLDTLDQPFWTMLNDIVYLPGGRRLLSIDMEGYKVWRAGDLKLLSTDSSYLFYLCTGLLSPDGKSVCISERPDGCDIYDRRSDKLLYSLDGVEGLSFSDDGKRLLVADKESGAMEIWKIGTRNTWKRQSVLCLTGPDTTLYAASFSKDGRQLVSAHGDGTIRVWNACNGAEREVLHWDGRDIDGVSFSPDGSRIAAYSIKGGYYCIWGPFSWVI